MDRLASILEFERKLRLSKNKEETLLLSVNLLRTLFPYRSAMGFLYQGALRPIAYSDTPHFNPKTPFALSVAKAVSALSYTEGGVVLPSATLEGSLAEQGLEHALYLPLFRTAENRLYGGIVFFSERGFGKEAKVTAEHCAEVISLVLAAQRGKFHIPLRFGAKYRFAAALLAAIGSIPVPVAVQAKTRVVPLDPHVVTAPMNGVVKSVGVKSGDAVRKGDFLIAYDDLEIRGKQRIAAQTINISQSEITKQERASFFDPAIRNRLEESRADRAVKTMEYRAISSQLRKLTLFSPEEGTVVLDNPRELVGKPVKMGEKLLMIVDPGRVEFEILIPAHESNTIQNGDRVSVFLDNAPFDPIEGKIERILYESVLTPGDIVSYKAYVSLPAGAVPPLGMCGNAKVKGEEVPLIWYLLRRPVAFMRWYFG